MLMMFKILANSEAKMLSPKMGRKYGNFFSAFRDSKDINENRLCYLKSVNVISSNPQFIEWHA